MPAKTEEKHTANLKYNGCNRCLNHRSMITFSEAPMSARLASLLVVAAVLSLSINAPLLAKNKDKKKSVVPEYVLRAQTVRVIVAPDAGEPLDQPMANSTARDNVEKAFSEWGRYRVVMDGQQADLVISVRTGSGNMTRPTIKG